MRPARYDQSMSDADVTEAAREAISGDADALVELVRRVVRDDLATSTSTPNLDARLAALEEQMRRIEILLATMAVGQRVPDPLPGNPIGVIPQEEAPLTIGGPFTAPFRSPFQPFVRKWAEPTWAGTGTTNSGGTINPWSTPMPGLLYKSDAGGNLHVSG